MSKLIKLSAIPEEAVIHDFGTLALLPTLRDIDLHTAAGGNALYVVQLDNGHYYALTALVANTLLQIKAELGAGLNANASGMVWTKGANVPFHFITVINGTQTSERRVVSEQINYQSFD